MGKSTTASGTTIVKYHIYYAGYHMVLCHSAAVTHLLKIRIDDLDAFDGDVVAPNWININQPQLFGGPSSEGGIFGTFSLLDGNWTQLEEDYLQYKQGWPGPAYRGVVSLISRGCALQYNNPYLKDPTFKVFCSHAHWLTSIREIIITEVYYETELVLREDSICTWDRWSLGLCEIPSYQSPPDSWATQAEIDDPAGWTDGTYVYLPDNPIPQLIPPPTPETTTLLEDWRQECEYLADEFGQVSFVCKWHYDGGASFAFEDLLSPMNDTSDYVEVQVRKERYQFAGMNPAHIVYATLTDPFWGKGLSLYDLDLPSFEAAAYALYAEGFALSILWSKQSSIEDFLQLIMDHIGGILVRPVTTNLYTLRLLRPNEAPSFHLTAEHVVRIEEYEEAGWAGTTNEYSVKYTDVLDGKTKSVTVQDLASLERQGGVAVTESKEYLGLPTLELAERVAWRDLLFSTVPIKKMTVVTDRSAYAVSPGDVIAVTWPPYDLDGMAFRVTEVDYGTPTSNEITLSLITDPYISDLPETLVTPPVVIPAPNAPRDASPIALYEAPYWHVKTYQESQGFPVDLLDPYSFLVALGGSPQSNGTNLKSLFQQNALAPVEGSNARFCGVVRLKFPIDKTSTELFLDNTYMKLLGSFTAGSLAYLGGTELVEVVSLSLTTMVLTVHRGILDTIPKAHAAGAYLLSFNSGELARSYATWLAGDTAKAWLLTQATTGTLSVADATQQSLTIAGRQGRPLAPGGLSINGGYLAKTFIDDFIVIWKHRNRLTQTTPTFIHQTDSSVVPEDGTEYQFTVYGDNGTMFLSGTATEAGGDATPISTVTLYEHDVAADATNVDGIVTLATTTGNLHTGAGFVSDNTFYSLHTTELQFKWRYTGARYAVRPFHFLLCPPGFTRESYYGGINQGLGVGIGGNSVSGWTYYGLITQSDTYVVHTTTFAPVAGTDYTFNLLLNWDTNTYELRLDGVLKHSGTIPLAYQDQHLSYQVAAQFPNYNTVGTVILSETSIRSDGALAFSLGADTLESVVSWDGLSLTLADEETASGRVNSKLRFVLSTSRDGLTALDTWDHTAYRTTSSAALPMTNLDFAGGNLIGWTTLTGTPMARAVSELGFTSCGTSTYALGNTVAGLANQWAVYQDVDLLSVLTQEIIDEGLALLQITLRHRATQANSYGMVYVEFFDADLVSLGFESSGAFSIPTTSMGTKIVQVPVPAGGQHARLTLSCNSTSGNVTGYFGCIAPLAYFNV